MPCCPQCPNRVFKDENAVRMHRESYKHPRYTCVHCNKVLNSQQALDSHTNAKHPSIECRYCNRTFNSENAREQHENAKHSFECRYCDREFSSERARDQHEDASHSTFECRYCDREFNSEQAREQHENAKHAFECRYCDREFPSERARDQHEDAIHSTFECRYCDREFNSEDAREQHENAKHVFKCRHCNSISSSEYFRTQHESTRHCFKCDLCSKVFFQAATLRQHKQTTSHFECSYCTAKFFTATSKSWHELSCSQNPANHVTRPTTALSDQSSSTHLEEVSSPSATTSTTDEEPEPLASPSRSSLDEGEMFQLTSDLPSTDAIDKETTAPHPCPRAHSIEPCTCSISLHSKLDEPAVVDAHTINSLDGNHRDGSHNFLEPTLQCTPCLKLFETEEALRHHVCAFRTTIVRPHCPVCYTQFDDVSTLQRHLEGLQAFSCQLCWARCCSDEMLQDHLLSHPTCSKCGKSFADNLALCAHVELDHPVVVCWDCGGIVIEKDSLELHYADSSAHPTCVFCGVGTRNSADMDEHVKHAHPSNTEMKDYPEGDDINVRNVDEGSPLMGTRYFGANREEFTEQLEVANPPLSSSVEISDPLGGTGIEPEGTPLETESSLSSSHRHSMPHPAEEALQNVIKEEEADVVCQHQHAYPSLTRSEHGSDTNQSQMLASKVTNIATNSDTRPPSPDSFESGGSLSDLSSPTSSSSNSAVFVSADGIPDYIRENRAVLVATSSGSPSSSCAPLRPSSSSLGSFDMSKLTRVRESSASDTDLPRTSAVMAAGAGAGAMYRLHCRICLRDPCEDMTATICGHIFCKRCITQAVIAKSECPVCGSATFLYCLFKLDLSA